MEEDVNAHGSLNCCIKTCKYINLIDSVHFLEQVNTFTNNFLSRENRGRIEGQEMMKIYSGYPILVDLIKLREDSRSTSAMKDQIMVLEQGLQFLLIYTEMLSLLDKGEHPTGKYLNFGVMSRIDPTLKRKGISKIGVLAMQSGEFKDWDVLAAELLKEINGYKSSIWEDCSFFSEGLYNGYWFTTKFLLKFMSYTDVSMANILNLKCDMSIDEKMKFESLKEKLNMFRNVFKYVEEIHSDCWDFKIALNAWVWNAAYLCLLYWVLDENMASEGNLMLSKMYKNFDSPHPKVIDYCNKYFKSHDISVEERCCKVDEVVCPEVTRICFSYLNSTKPSSDKRQEACEIAFGFIEYLHCKLRKYLPKDAIEMLRNAMLMLIAFVTDPPSEQTEEGKLVLSRTQEALKKAGTLIISLGSDEKNEADIVEATNFLLHDFFDTVFTIQAEVRKAYSIIFLDPSFNFPRFNMINFFDSSIGKFKEFASCFPNLPILTLERGIVVLRDLLKASNLKDKFVLELKNERIGSKDLWTRIANIAHQVDRIILSNSYENSIGLNTILLLYVQEEIKNLLPKVKKIKEKHVQDSYSSRNKMILNHMAPSKSNVEEIDEVIVGFEDKAKEIRERLTCGIEKLDIISIIGMAGLGKTTLAKKVYNDPLVKRHFTACAWCTVSQSYDPKKLLLDILEDVTVVNASFAEMEKDDLVDKLRKCLKGKRYLIVMDDIWDVEAWKELKLSFPDDKNYSRILFTSRIHEVVLDAKPDSFLYPLSQLSDLESWELLERRVFNDKDICPRNFLQDGKQIAIDCNGLPLAVVLVAGLLKKEIDNLDWWKKVGKSLDSRIAKEGCAHILELSYNHLSEPLKACFLYLGLFKEDKLIKVQKLVNLWVSEGFVQREKVKDAEIIAKEYVMDLIGRSLLIVSNKSSRGGIKACRIHDLLGEFCLAKRKEEYFFKLLHGKNVSYHAMDEHYRVSIQTQHWKHFFVRKSSPLHSVRICPTGISYIFNVNPNSFCSARFLNVLDLEEAMFFGDFPEEITTLIFLRYLAIWCTTKFIPATIARLEKLETLLVISKNTFILPAEILRMESLRHVHIGKFFPHVLFGTILPMKNILSFSTPCVTYGKVTETFLSKLRTIQKLKCQFGSYQQNQMVKLDFLNELESLNLAHDGRPRLRSFVFSLPTNIKKLTLSNFGLPWSEISRIAELPNLEVLKLLVNAFMGNVWNMEFEEFKRLKFLKLQGLNIQKWSASHENFPTLEQIVVEQCHKLEDIPIAFVEISTLQNIHIRRCRSSVVKSAKEIEDQQIELGTLNFKMQAIQILTEKLFG